MALGVSPVALWGCDERDLVTVQRILEEVNR